MVYSIGAFESSGFREQLQSFGAMAVKFLILVEFLVIQMTLENIELYLLHRGLHKEIYIYCPDV